jgi:hypothetical protein
MYQLFLAGSQVGTATTDADGNFSTSMVVPNVAPNTYTLTAQQSGTVVASTSVTVYGATQTAQPLLQRIDPSSGRVLGPNWLAGQSVTVRGEGFAAGGTATVSLNGASSSVQVATAPVGSDSSFKATFTSSNSGTFQLVATEPSGGGTISSPPLTVTITVLP